MSPSTTRTAHSKRTLEMTFIAIFVVLIAICSWISIPTAVPFTLQTFAISMTVLMLGGRRGTISILVFILLAAIGVPVLSGFSGGLGVLLGPTGGYILGFLLTALVYWLLTKLFGESLPVRLGAILTGIAVMYLFGTLWFVKVYTAGGDSITFGGALMLCVVPFLIPEVIKQVLAFTLSARLRPHMHLDD
jgi:biotin transport system substrate-specific component